MRSLSLENSLISALSSGWVSLTLLSMFARRGALDNAEDLAKVLHGGKAHFFGDADGLDDRFLQESAGLFLSTFVW